MITIKDNTGTSTIHIPNTGGGDDYITTGVYEFEIGRINDKIDNFDKLNDLVNKELAQAELNNIKNKIF